MTAARSERTRVRSLPAIQTLPGFPHHPPKAWCGVRLLPWLGGAGTGQVRLGGWVYIAGSPSLLLSSRPAGICPLPGLSFLGNAEPDHPSPFSFMKSSFPHAHQWPNKAERHKITDRLWLDTSCRCEVPWQQNSAERAGKTLGSRLK